MHCQLCDQKLTPVEQFLAGSFRYRGMHPRCYVMCHRRERRHLTKTVMHLPNGRSVMGYGRLDGQPKRHLDKKATKGYDEGLLAKMAQYKRQLDIDTGLTLQGEETMAQVKKNASTLGQSFNEKFPETIVEKLEREAGTESREPRPVEGINWEWYDKTRARNLLANRLQNRPIYKAGVRRYKNDMNDGTFSEKHRTQAPILIGKDGRLSDGQHRLTALLESDLEELWMITIRDATDEERHLQDTGLTRSLGDKVAMFHGMPILSNITSRNKTKAITVCRLLASMIDEVPYANIEPDRVAEVAVQYDAALQSLNDQLTKGGHLSASAPMMAAVAYSASLMNKNAWDDAVVKLDMKADIEEDSPLFQLQRLIENKENTRRLEPLFLNTLCALKMIHQNRVGDLTPIRAHMKDW